MTKWIESLGKITESAVKTGEFKPDIDTEQFAFDLYSLLLGFHHYQRMLDDEKTHTRQEAALERLLDVYSAGDGR